MKVTKGFNSGKAAPGDGDFSTLSQKAYATLSDWLISGRLGPGERLVNRSLATAMGLSMTPVREAIHRLLSDGVVEHVEGAGARVRKIDNREAMQLYELRCLLEPVAARHAAENARPLQLYEMECVVDRGLALVHATVPEGDSLSPDAFLQLTKIDAAFHELVIQAADNRWLEKSLLSTRFVLRMFFAHFESMGQLQRKPMQETWECHRAIFESIRARDQNAARTLMQEHISTGQQTFLTHLTNKLGEAWRSGSEK